MNEKQELIREIEYKYEYCLAHRAKFKDEEVKRRFKGVIDTMGQLDDLSVGLLNDVFEATVFAVCHLEDLGQVNIMSYYHISPIENKESILATGLKSNDGIFVFTELEQAIHIASNQLGIDKYSIFEIDVDGITGDILNDNVSEFGSDCQYTFDQELVEAKYVKHIKDELLNIFDMINETEAIKFRAIGYSEEQIIEIMCLFPDRVARYNEVHGTNYKHNKG